MNTSFVLNTSWHCDCQLYAALAAVRVIQVLEFCSGWPFGLLVVAGPLPDLGPPKQLLLSPGDVVFAHSELGHCAGCRGWGEVGDEAQIVPFLRSSTQRIAGLSITANMVCYTRLRLIALPVSRHCSRTRASTRRASTAHMMCCHVLPTLSWCTASGSGRLL